MAQISNGGIELHVSERGNPAGVPIVLVHGLLWSSRMYRRLADLLPDAYVLLVDLRGHGPSSKPADLAEYSWKSLASDVIAVLDHLSIERAVVGGLSLGANVALATGNEHPGRVSGLVVEMPVLDQSAPFAMQVFPRLADVLHAAAPVLGPFGAAVAHIPAPRNIPEVAALRDVLSLQPRAAEALIRGLVADQLLFEDLHFDVLTMPALVIGHHGDALHHFGDAEELSYRMLDARLIERHTILDYRVRPDLLARELVPFLARVEARSA